MPVEVVEDQLSLAGSRAGESESGIGAAVVRSIPTETTRLWYCIVTDCHEWHYLHVYGVDTGPFPNLTPEQIEDGIERFAATLPAAYRMRHLLDADPLHVDRSGSVRD
jgi:hypothetical protein